MAYLWEAVYGVLVHLSGVFPTERELSQNRVFYAVSGSLSPYRVTCVLIG